MSEQRLPVAQLEGRVADAFVRAGASAANAASVARALVLAEADGLKGHGLSRLPSYLAMLRAGKTDGRAVAALTRPRPGVLAIDAANGFAYPALDLAVAEVPAAAREQGLAAAAMRRSGHCGVAGHPVERLAEQGLVAILFANTPGAIAPWGGRTATFGTNPIAFAAPRAEGEPPIVVDLSVSTVARGNILAAKQRGEPIPTGWALDPEGRDTTDPDAALAGTMLPLGGAKGAALALMVEVLAGALLSANLAFEASSFLDDKGPPPGTGQLIIALDPAAFGPHYGERIGTLCAAIEAQDGARLPGTRRLASRAAAARDGLAVGPATLALLAPS